MCFGTRVTGTVPQDSMYFCAEPHELNKEMLPLRNRAHRCQWNSGSETDGISEGFVHLEALYYPCRAAEEGALSLRAGGNVPRSRDVYLHPGR